VYLIFAIVGARGIGNMGNRECCAGYFVARSLIPLFLNMFNMFKHELQDLPSKELKF